MVLAFTRAVSPLIEKCELTHLARAPIDYVRAVAEHDQYGALLTRLGCRVERLPDAPELPDSVFVEDTTIVFDDVAVIARPGARSPPRHRTRSSCLRRTRSRAAPAHPAGVPRDTRAASVAPHTDHVQRQPARNRSAPGPGASAHIFRSAGKRPA